MLAEVTEILDAGEAEDGDVQTKAVDFSGWKSGTEEYEGLTLEDIFKIFGLTGHSIPRMAERIDIRGSEHDPWSEAGQKLLGGSEARELKLFWHQGIGVLKIMDNLMAGRNLLVMDGVGVGKTLQAVASIALYEWLKDFKEQEKRYPRRWSEPP